VIFTRPTERGYASFSSPNDSEHPPPVLHVYGWRRDGGPFFLDNPRTLEDGIAFAETVLKDCRRGFVRAEVKDIRSLHVVWTSDGGSV
jgi:hypothetical protein